MQTPVPSAVPELCRNPLVLVAAQEELALQTADFYERNRDFLRKYEPIREEAFYTWDYQRGLLRAQAEMAAQKTGFTFYLRHEEVPGKLIGSIALNNIVWGAFRSCHLGYKMDGSYLNRGYMTLAVELVTEFAFSRLGLHRMEANIMPCNLRSRRVLEKNGFQSEGISPDYLLINGVWEDHIHMVKLNPGCPI